MSNGLKTISSSAFSGCSSIEKLKLPNSLETIDIGAFSGCSNLNQVYYFGDDFNNISIGTNNSLLLNANVTYLKLGDTDCDNVVCVRDATFVQLYLANIISSNEEDLVCADVNCDGVISIMDATLIQMYIANLIESF